MEYINDSSVSTVTGYGLEDRNSIPGRTITSRRVLGPPSTCPSNRNRMWCGRSVKWSLLPTNARLRMLYLHTCSWAYLIKHRHNFVYFLQW